MIEIEIRKRSDDYHTQIKDQPKIWDCGKTITEAIGNLIRTHPEEFNIKIKVL